MTDRVILERSAWVPTDAPLEDQGPLLMRAFELPDGTYAYAFSDQTTQTKLVELQDKVDTLESQVAKGNELIRTVILQLQAGIKTAVGSVSNVPVPNLT